MGSIWFGREGRLFLSYVISLRVHLVSFRFSDFFVFYVPNDMSKVTNGIKVKWSLAVANLIMSAFLRIKMRHDVKFWRYYKVERIFLKNFSV